MRKLFWLFLFVPAIAFTQVSNPSIISVATAPTGSCSGGLPNQQVVSTGVQYTCQSGTWAAIGGSGSLPAATAKGQAVTSSAAGTTYTAVNPGVINVRTMYGAVPDGSTDNSTAIAAAFTASNAITTGVPTVYFDCNGASVTCQYNFGGSGISPINPIIPSTVACAPGVILNYTGTAHVVDLGATSLVRTVGMPYMIQNCTFIGGSTSTQGIFINNLISNTIIKGNTFHDFGNRTGFNIYYASNNWESLVEGNSWYDDDGVTRNILDAHNASVNAVRIIGNNSECDNLVGPCSISTIGVGFWVGGDTSVVGNVIQYHAPLLRLANSSASPAIIGNHFEGNSGATTSAITYGDPGVPGSYSQIACATFSGNSIYYPAAAGVSIFGPEIPSTTQYYLSGCPIRDNTMSPAPTTYYVNTNGGVGNIWGRNRMASAILTAANTSPSVFDLNSANYFETTANHGISGAMAAFNADEQSITPASSQSLTNMVQCNDVNGSPTTQSCNAAFYFVPAAGNCIIYSTTTTNTGALTLTVNGTNSPVRKRQGTVALAAGDLLAGHNTWMCYDGTAWDLLDPVTQ